MYFTFSHHSLKRREHLEKRKESELLEWMRHIENFINFEDTIIGNMYKVHSGGSQVIMKRRNEDTIHIITFIGFKDKEKRPFMKFKIRDIQEHQDQKVSIRQDGRTKVCGSFGEDSSGKFLKFKDYIPEKYDIGLEDPMVRYENIEDLDMLIEKDKHGRWKLRDFPEREGVFRTNFKGKEVKCAYFCEDAEGKFVRFKKGLREKFELGLGSDILRYQDVSELEAFMAKNKEGEWRLRDFPRIRNF